MKIFNRTYVLSEFSKGDDNRITREIAALKSVNHPNVVSYVDDGAFTDNGVEYLYVVMDYLEGDDLQNYVAKHNLSEEDILSIFQCVVASNDCFISRMLLIIDVFPELFPPQRIVIGLKSMIESLYDL